MVHRYICVTSSFVWMLRRNNDHSSFQLHFTFMPVSALSALARSTLLLLALALPVHSFSITGYSFPALARSSSKPQSGSLQLSAVDQHPARKADCTATDARPRLNRRLLLEGVACGFIAGSLPLPVIADADEDRIKAGYDTLNDLIDNWSKYAGVGKEAVNGDNVRRQIGTVGNKSPLFNIRKVFLRKGADIDLFEAFEKEYAQIEANSYSAIFADYSTSPKRGYQYIEDAYNNTKKTRSIYKELMQDLGIKY